MNRKTQKSQKLMNKSGKYCCDICLEKNILEDHHIKGRKIPNYNHPSNRTNICSNCHTKVHVGEIIIEKWVMTTSGLKLLWHNKNDISLTGEEAKPYIY